MVLLLNTRKVYYWLRYTMMEKQSIADVQEKLAPIYDPIINTYIKKNGFHTLPSQITLIALKEEKLLELWFESGDTLAKIKSYPILAASGKRGPKLEEGDLQVPEGIYGIAYFNPNSLFYLSMKVTYPNAFDVLQAEKEGRQNLGGDIFIHGKSSSVGCIAIGDEAIEELFYLSTLVGKEHIKIIISPNDLRIQPMPSTYEKPWIKDLYEHIKMEMEMYR